VILPEFHTRSIQNDLTIGLSVIFTQKVKLRRYWGKH